MDEQHAEQALEELAALVSLAKRHQATVEKMMDGADATSAALGHQIAALKSATGAVRLAAQEGARDANIRALEGMEKSAAKALSAATQPAVAQLEATVSAAGALEASLRRAVEWFSWRLAAKLALVFGAAVAVLWLVGWVSLSRLGAEREALLAEVAQLRAQASRLKVVDCEKVGGPKGRQCLPINIRSLYGDTKAEVLYYPVWGNERP